MLLVPSVEVNLDGLVGSTHNYAGLSYGNVASAAHALTASNPREAALEGVRKMKFLHELGIPQLVMPPQHRPDSAILRRLGYQNISQVPDVLLGQVYSASSMWAANAATVSPGGDTEDGKVHITPANLTSKFHRSLECEATSACLKQIFPSPHFVHHDALPPHSAYCDEGAANHMRLHSGSERGTEVFVYGGASKTYPARQSKQAYEAIIRLHRLNPQKAVLLEQSAAAIDAGVFHNDVIAMSNAHLFIYHEHAYTRMDERLDCFTHVIIREKDLPMRDAVASYFFNSQLITLPQGGMAIVAPRECEENPNAKACLDRLIALGHVASVFYLDVRESMKNGGGPACLRLRLALTAEERDAVPATLWFNDALAGALCRWIEKHYRDRLTADDLRDEELAEESRRALTELSALLGITI